MSATGTGQRPGQPTINNRHQSSAQLKNKVNIGSRCLVPLHLRPQCDITLSTVNSLLAAVESRLVSGARSETLSWKLFVTCKIFLADNRKAPCIVGSNLIPSNYTASSFCSDIYISFFIHFTSTHNRHSLGSNSFVIF